MRSVIGAALQEAALDPLLTGRDHLRLQTMLQGIPRPERRGRQDELLDRVGLTEAADRKVGGYSGGMKRRLDLALALVHRPSILFLDEPTTGLDPQSRSALWDEVARLARDDGVTVFLTTQYLEEADVLADRVGIIDHGRIVAEGTPAELKAEIGTAQRPRAAVQRERRAADHRAAHALRRAARRRRRRRRPAPRRLRARRRDPRDGRRGRRRRRRRAARADARRRLPREDRPHARGRGEAAKTTDGDGERRSPPRSAPSPAARSRAPPGSRRARSRR